MQLTAKGSVVQMGFWVSDFSGGSRAQHCAARMRRIVAEVRSGGKANGKEAGAAAGHKGRFARCARTGEESTTNPGAGTRGGFATPARRRALPAPALRQPYGTAGGAAARGRRAPRDIFGIRSRARRRGRELAVVSPGWRPVDIRTEGPQDERSRTIRRRNEVPSEARNDGPRHAAAWRGPQIFAKMSGMLDLSRDEKAKHLLPR